MKETVFITDGQWRKTLAAVRALGREGFIVWVGDKWKLSTSFFSKYCKRKVIYPDPVKYHEKFRQFMLDFISSERPDVTIPADDETVKFFSKNKDILQEYTKIPVANYETIELANNKAEIIQIAKKIGIPIPKTSIVNDVESIDIPSNFPLIVKPNLGSGSRGMFVVNDEEQLFNAVQEITKKGMIALVQEKIPMEGAGYGVSALLNWKSEVRAIFVHKRLREYPVRGGPSTLRISVKYPELAKLGVKLLKYIGFQGAAMVEFKMDPRDNSPKLMEINPRLWGSLQLAIASGVNFPLYLVKLALDGDVEEVTDYKEGIIARWLLPGDILHFLSNPERFSLKPSFFKFFGKNLTYDIIDFRDPIPIFIRIFNMIKFMFNSEMRKIVFR
ncbi:carboxylate--amine ligase [bacterium]|nr:MAG: carboxylate--amine ligase [bacterium]